MRDSVTSGPGRRRGLGPAPAWVILAVLICVLAGSTTAFARTDWWQLKRRLTTATTTQAPATTTKPPPATTPAAPGCDDDAHDDDVTSGYVYDESGVGVGGE